jgi:hypothetical protein
MLLKLRYWMLIKLAGKLPVMINVTVEDGVVTVPAGTNDGLIYGGTFKRSRGIVIAVSEASGIRIEGNVIR